MSMRTASISDSISPIVHKWMLVCTLLPALLLSCTKETIDAEIPVVAEIGGEQLTLEDALDKIPPALLNADSARAISQFADQWTAERLWLREAVRIGLHEDPEFLDRAERAREQLLIQYLQETVLRENAAELTVEKEDAQVYYQEHKDKFILNEKFLKIWMISTQTRADAVRAREELMRGIPREKVYEKYHVDSGSQSYHGELFHPLSWLLNDLPFMKTYLENMGRNELSPVLSFQGKYHFIQIMDEKTTDETPDLEWLIETLQGMLQRENSAKILNSFIRSLSLRAESNLEINRMSEDQIRTILNEK